MNLQESRVLTTDSLSTGDGAGEATPVSLIEGMRRADPEAWFRLTELWTPLIYARCRRSGLNAEDAEDVSQNVLVRVYAGLAGFQRNGVTNRFRFWISTITRNLLADFWKARKARPLAEGGSDARQFIENHAAPGESPDDPLFQPAQLVAQALRIVQRDVATSSWQAFQLVQYQHLTHREASEKLKMTEGAVRVANHRIRERLRAELEGMLD
jgi:RNA polymerase sigma-70 factor (ECF subfamily)